MTRLERFLAFVEYDPFGGCHLWTGATRRGAGKRPSTRDYPAFWNGERTVRATTWLCEELGVEVPPGHERDHKCRVTLCVNLAHLEIVPKVENIARMWLARREQIKDKST